MKHFGALLTGVNNTVDGGDTSVLTIGTAASNNDSIVIHNEAPVTATAVKIPTTDFGLTLVPYSTITFTGTNSDIISHVLGADGREVAVADLATAVNTNLFVPISNGTAFVNSEISQSSTAAGDITITLGSSLNDMVIISGGLQVNGTTTTVNSTTVNVADRFLQVGDTGTSTTATTAITGGLIVETSNDGSGTKAFGGIRYNGTAWQVSSDPGADGLDAGATWTNLGVAGAGVEVVQGGSGISVAAPATAAATDGLMADTNNPVVRVELTTVGITDGTTTAGGGLSRDGATAATQTIGIATGGITAGQLATDIANTRAGLVNGTAGQVLTSQANGGFAWGNAGTVAKFAGTFTGAAQLISIPTGTVGTSVANSSHGLSGSDFTVTVYEYLQNGSTTQHSGSGDVAGLRISQIIPEGITIGRDSSGSGANLEGTVNIILPSTQNGNQLRVVIKS